MITKRLPGMFRIMKRMDKVVVKNESWLGAPSVRQRFSKDP